MMRAFMILRGMNVMEELTSIFLTPYLLLPVVPKRVDAILQFIMDFTVDVEGVRSCLQVLKIMATENTVHPLIHTRIRGFPGENGEIILDVRPICNANSKPF